MDYLQALRVNMAVSGYSKSSMGTYVKQARLFMDFVKKEMVDVVESDIKDYLFFLLDIKKNNINSVCTTFYSLRYFFRNVVRSDCMEELKSPKGFRRCPSVLSVEEVKQLVDACMTLTEECVVGILYGCGLRSAELRSLHKKDINFDRQTLHIRETKSRIDRFVPIPDVLVPKLRRLLRFSPTSTVYVILSCYNRPYTEVGLYILIQKIALRSGIDKKVYPHLLRHTFATHLLEQGVDIRTIQVLLGHKHLQSTEIYTHLSNTLLHSVKSPLDNLYTE